MTGEGGGPSLKLSVFNNNKINTVTQECWKDREYDFLSKAPYWQQFIFFWGGHQVQSFLTPLLFSIIFTGVTYSLWQVEASSDIGHPFTKAKGLPKFQSIQSSIWSCTSENIRILIIVFFSTIIWFEIQWYLVRQYTLVGHIPR